MLTVFSSEISVSNVGDRLVGYFFTILALIFLLFLRVTLLRKLKRK
jgi:uncharacterized membrane protein YkvI